MVTRFGFVSSFCGASRILADQPQAVVVAPYTGSGR